MRWSVARGLDGNGTVNNPQTGDCDIGAYEYAEYVINFFTGSSAQAEQGPAPGSPAGTLGPTANNLISVVLTVLDPSLTTLPAAVTVPVTVHPTQSTAASGPNGDFAVVGNSVVFPAGSAVVANPNGSRTVTRTFTVQVFDDLYDG